MFDDIIKSKDDEVLDKDMYFEKIQVKFNENQFLMSEMFKMYDQPQDLNYLGGVFLDMYVFFGKKLDVADKPVFKYKEKFYEVVTRKAENSDDIIKDIDKENYDKIFLYNIQEIKLKEKGISYVIRYCGIKEEV